MALIWIQEYKYLSVIWVISICQKYYFFGDIGKLILESLIILI